MVDLILFVFFFGIAFGAFFLGLHVGKVHGTFGKWLEEIGRKVSDKEK